MNWLRARARAKRWEEERAIVKQEAKNVVAWMKFQVTRWENIFTTNQDECKPGHASYSRKQYFTWKSLLEDAEAKLGDVE